MNATSNKADEWEKTRKTVRDLIVEKRRDLTDVRVIVFKPTQKYQNVAKRTGVDKLTPARAAIAELVRRYSALGIECSLLEVHKLGYFLERFNNKLSIPPFEFDFGANRFGPYSDKLKHMLNGLDGSYLHCDKRLSDAGPFEPIRFDEAKRERVASFMKSEGKSYLPAVEATADLIDGFESPLGMELLATVDWLVERMGADSTVRAIQEKLQSWPGGDGSADRKMRLFEERIIDIAILSLRQAKLIA